MLDLKIVGGTEERRAAAKRILEEAYGVHVGGYDISIAWTEDGWAVRGAVGRSGRSTAGDVIPALKQTLVSDGVRDALRAGGENVEGDPRVRWLYTSNANAAPPSDATEWVALLRAQFGSSAQVDFVARDNGRWWVARAELPPTIGSKGPREIRREVTEALRTAGKRVVD